MGGLLAQLQQLTNSQKEGEKRPTRKAFLSSKWNGEDFAGFNMANSKDRQTEKKHFIASEEACNT